MEYLNYILQKLRRNPTPRILLDGLNKLGIRIMPFYVFSEGHFSGTIHKKKNEFNEYEIVFLGPKDMREMSEIPFRYICEKRLQKRLKDGNLCLGIRYHGELVAFTWCDLTRCNFTGLNFLLEKDEAYLYDAYTNPLFRGKGIAPYLRCQLYKNLAEIGKHQLFSVSEYFNKPSIRFKKKLNAKIIGKGLIIDLFNKWHFNSKFNKRVRNYIKKF
jgi:hypothetical protein